MEFYNMCLVDQFCKIDDFSKEFEPKLNKRLISSGAKMRNRECKMSLSERMLIMIMFHAYGYRNFKTFYIDYISKHCTDIFPNLLSYNRFVELEPSLLLALTVFLYTQKGKCTGISFIDSTSIKVCLKSRAKKNKVFGKIAGWGKSSVDWFYGLKLHIIVNDEGELLAFCITSGNTDDRVPVRGMTKNIFGKMFGDKGYLSRDLFFDLLENGTFLYTTLKKNMKNKFMNISDKILLRKRVIVETVNDQLKNISQIEHSRHRSVINCFVNIIAGLIAYCFQSKKPTLGLEKNIMLPALG